MALPSSRRPVEIEEYIEEEFEERRVQPLKVVLSKPKIFLQHMVLWYQKLKPSKRRTLTPKLLKRQAVEVCHVLKYDYDNLPLNWVETLKKDCGLVLYPSKKERKRQLKSLEAELSLLPKPAPRPSDTTITRFPRAAKRFSLEPQIGTEASTCSEGSSKSNEDSGFSGLQTPSLNSGTGTTNKKRRVKKIIDLTKQPPPPFWLAAYATGIVLPRHLTVCSNEHSNILFYDYSPKFKDDEGHEIKLTAQPRFNFNALLLNR